MSSFCSWNVCWLHGLHCSDYLHCFGLDPVSTAFYPATFDPKNLNILHQTRVYSASIRAEPDSFAEVWIFSLMFSQVLLTSSSSFKFSKAADLFIISIWYCSLTSGSLSFLKLNLCLSNLCVACLPTANLSLTFEITR